MVEMALFNWTVKCVIQVVIVMGVWGYFEGQPLPEWKADDPAWWLAAVLLIFSVYFGNAFLDTLFGCEHGEIYKKVLG
jgi:hypothetical protein